MQTQKNTNVTNETENTSQLLDEIIEDAINMGERGVPTEHLENYQFKVREEEIRTDSGVIVPKLRAIVREDTDQVVGTVGSHYKVLTHAEALDPILDNLNRRGLKTFKRVNLVDGGAKMFANIYFPSEEFGMGESSHDSVWPGISVVNSLDGSLKYRPETTLYRLACTNGMRIPIKMAGFEAIHSKNQNFDDIVEKILASVSDGSQFMSFQKMANIGKKFDTVDLLIDKMLEDKRFGFPKRYKDMVMNEIQKNTQIRFNTITLWDIYNAFQSVIEHHIIREKGKINRGRALEEDLFSYFNTVAV